MRAMPASVSSHREPSGATANHGFFVVNIVNVFLTIAAIPRLRCGALCLRQGVL